LPLAPDRSQHPGSCYRGALRAACPRPGSRGGTGQLRKRAAFLLASGAKLRCPRRWPERSMMRRIIIVSLFAAGCSRCGSNAEHQALPVADAGGPLAQMVAKVPVLDAGPPPPYVRQEKKYPPIPRQAHVAQIFVGDNLSRMPWNPPKARKRSREEAKALVAKIAAEVRRGADFDQLAKRESDWPMAAHNGAALGVVTEGQGGMLPIIDPKVFTMPVGSVTDPFESQIGF